MAPVPAAELLPRPVPQAGLLSNNASRAPANGNPRCSPPGPFSSARNPVGDQRKIGRRSSAPHGAPLCRREKLADPRHRGPPASAPGPTGACFARRAPWLTSTKRTKWPSTTLPVRWRCAARGDILMASPASGLPADPETCLWRATFVPWTPTAPQPVILPVHGQSLRFGDNNWLAPNCTVVGDVVTGKDCSIWFGAIVRGMCVPSDWERRQHPRRRQCCTAPGRQTDCTIGDGGQHRPQRHRSRLHRGGRCVDRDGSRRHGPGGRGPGAVVVAAGAVVLEGRRLAKGSCGPECLPSASRTMDPALNGTSPTRQSATGNMPAGLKNAD